MNVCVRYSIPIVNQGMAAVLAYLSQLAYLTEEFMSFIFKKVLRLPMEKRKRFSSYLLYALGEIILLVVGINLALWFNSRNSERVKDQDRVEMLHQLDLELSSHIEQ